MIRAWWSPCAGDRNAGDQLTRIVLERAGIPFEKIAPRRAQLLGSGSILEKVGPGWRGVVFGAGLMFERSQHDLRSATVLGVRGPLTAQRCRLPRSSTFFDLALLLELPAGRGDRVGVLPHYADLELADQVDADVVINITADVDEVLAQIASCHVVHTSSLHGAIFADALGVRRVVHHSPEVLGSGFKFRDWDAAVAARGIPQMRADAEAALERLRRIAA